MGDTDEDTFCKKMRKATRDIHAVSDALVNAKLAFGKKKSTHLLQLIDIAVSLNHFRTLCTKWACTPINLMTISRSIIAMF